MPGYADDDAGDDALARLLEQATVIERRIWARPAERHNDVVLKAEILLCSDNCLMVALQDPDASYEERAAAELVRAVIDVLGIDRQPCDSLDGARTGC